MVISGLTTFVILTALMTFLPPGTILGRKFQKSTQKTAAATV
jgi:hypothetical protein